MPYLKNIFEKYIEWPIAIYGLSSETEKALHIMNAYDIVGLLDSFHTDGCLYGKKIITLDECISEKVRLIIVVARPGSCKAITRKIGNLCKKNNIDLFDIRGKNLLADNRVSYNFNSIKGYTKTQLISLLKEVEAVSFDLFDTLVVRNVLESSDVIEIVKSQLEEREFYISDFIGKRIEAEKNLSRNGAPKLKYIYHQLLNDEDIAYRLSDLEYRIDCNLLQPRNDVVELIDIAKGLGKRVYITSESYYSKEQIKKILIDNYINNIDDVIVSCEFNTGKTDKLFEKLIEIAGTNNILHIGDDIVADIEASERYGLKSFQIYSSSELFEILGGLKLYNPGLNISDRIKIGMFIANIFNNPFQFEETDRKINVYDASDIGYLFVAPMILDFTKWFGEQVKENNLKNIWFSSRDGYLLQKLYNIIYPNEETEYFLTSRIAAIRAGMENISDIEYVDSMKYSGNLSDNLMARFGIKADEIPVSQINEKKSGLLKYSEAILDNAKLNKANYIKYIEKLKIKDGSIAFFDFVAKGTSQMYIQKIYPSDYIGLYFLQLEPEFMDKKNLNIRPFYTEEERESSAVFDNYYVLETILTSPDPSVNGFNEDGSVVFANETRKSRDIECLLKIQNGIIEYVEKYISICPKRDYKINKKLAETLLTLIHNVNIKDKDFLDLIIEDPFFNRMTDITDVL